MEKIVNGLDAERVHTSDLRGGHDAEPRDGPAVFVADARALDAGEGLIGQWIELGKPSGAQLLEALQAQGGRWVIVDQIGLGELMVDEDSSIEELLGEHQPEPQPIDG